MVRIHLIALGGLLFADTVASQDCSTIDYVTPQFAVRMEPGVLYGTAVRFDGGTDSLRMDIYKPVGDNVVARPLLIAIHGGAFVGGGRDDMDELCSWYAARGYVAATASYRLGFHPPADLSVPYTYDEAEVVRAAYRATQDVRGAMRFLLIRQAQDSTSAENTFLYGVSAGAITALQAAYLTDGSEKPALCGALAPVNTYARPDLGSLMGDLNPGPAPLVKGCVSHLGAMLDTAHINSTADPALFMYHQTGDPIVGCGYQQGLWGAPLGLWANYPMLFGSCVIAPRMQHLGFDMARYEFHEYSGDEHDIHDIPLVDSLAAVFLARQFCSAPTAMQRPVEAPALEVYPVPATEMVHVRRLGTSDLDLTLMGLDGREVRQGHGNSLDVRGLIPGTYVLVANDGGHRTAHRVQIAN